MKGMKGQALAVSVAVAILALACPASLAIEAVDNFQPPVLRDVMWQILPDNIRSVFVGPDKRIWWQLDHGTQRPSVREIREIIEGQFGSESPVIYAARIVLFEPGGRVWFITPHGFYLLGYDGERWIEREGLPILVGSCPDHGRYLNRGYNCILQERAFFLGASGVHCFDLKAETWTYQPFVLGFSDRALLLPEPDNQGLVAYYGESFGRDGRADKSLVLQRWRDGAWAPIPVPADVSTDRIAGVKVVKNGLWIDEQDASSSRRDRKGEGPKQRTGLRFIPFNPDDDRADPDPDNGAAFVLGPYRAKGALLDFYDGSGTVYFNARQIVKEGESVGAGMLVRGKAGGISLLLGERFAERARYWYSDHDSGPVGVAGQELVWMPGVRFGAPSQLYSLEDGSALATMPDERFRWLHAARDDGTVFASQYCFGGADNTHPIAVYKPGAEDDRVILESQKIKARRLCITSDGSVWAAGTGRGVLRFDGERWHSPEAFKDATQVTWLIPGRNGEMLAEAGGGVLFLVGEQLFRAKDLETLIADHKKEFAEAFFMGSPSPRRGSIVADKARNIWLCRNHYGPGALKVLAGDAWLDATDLLRKMGSTDGNMLYIASVGDGSMIYATDLKTESMDDRSFYGEVVDGQLVFTPAPHCNEERYIHLRVTDHNGGTWIPAEFTVRNTGGGGGVFGQIAYRLLGNFEEEYLVNAGWPVLCDQSGNVWLTRVWDDKGALFNIWSEGKLAHSITIPGARVYNVSRLVSDRPGSVYAWSLTGIYHLTADDPARPAEYTIKEHYFAGSIKGTIKYVGYSSLGYMVMHTSKFLYLIKLPPPEEE